jgi:FkbM family methyltransferase
MKALILKALNAFGYGVVRLQDESFNPIEVFPLIVRDYISRKQANDFFFVQIGANDGVKHDPIRKLIRENWRGILVEPIPAQFSALKKNYAGQAGFVFENAAITDFDGTTTLFCSNGPEKESVFASLHKRSVVIAQHKPESQPGTKLESMEVKAMTLGTLFDKYKVQQMDLFQVDTEGHDFSIVMQLFNKTSLRPPIIQFEHSFLSKEEEYRLYAFLSKEGYQVLPVGIDTVALRHNEK